MAASKFKIPRYCAFCGRFFLAKTITSYYCCRQCSKDASNEKIKAQRREARRIKKIEELNKSGIKYISITNALALFEVSRSSIRRCVIAKKIASKRIGTKKILVNWKDLNDLYSQKATTNTVEPKLYNMNPDNCYSIGEIIQKFGVSEKTVYTHIRKYSIPIRQIGQFVYAPKQEIDNLYKNII